MESEAKKTSWSQIGPEEQFLIRRVIRKIAVLGAQIFIENWSRIEIYWKNLLTSFLQKISLFYKYFCFSKKKNSLRIPPTHAAQFQGLQANLILQTKPCCLFLTFFKNPGGSNSSNRNSCNGNCPYSWNEPTRTCVFHY